MKKGEIYEGVIEKVDFPNKGIVITDGQKVTVKNGMPGQKVRFMINKKRSGRAEGRLLEVLEKSPLETREPVCSIFPECGGCMYQTQRQRTILICITKGEFHFISISEFNGASMNSLPLVISAVQCTKKAVPMIFLQKMTVNWFMKI